MERCQAGLPAKADNDYPNLWQAFPGFATDLGFGAGLVFSDRLQRTVRARDLEALADKQANAAVEAAVELYLAEIEAMAQSAQPRVIVCAIPLALLKDDGVADADESDSERETPQGLSGRFHDLLKARAMRFRVPLQLMRPSTYDPKLARGTKKRPGMPAQLQDEATRAWNFLAALYYKAGGTPWRMVRDDAALESCFVGITFYWTQQGGSIASSVAQVFNERGDGVVVRGGPATRSMEDRQLHLAENDASELLRGALKAYRDEHKHLPARVVVHKTSAFDAGETEGMLRAAHDQDLESAELLWVSQNPGARLYRDGYQPPLRGTLTELEPDHALLYTRGAVEYYGTYPGQYVPTPIALRAHRCDRSLHELAEEVLALSKMNWNSTQFDGRLPVSIRTARQVAEIVRRLRADDPVEPRYSLYM